MVEGLWSSIEHDYKCRIIVRPCKANGVWTVSMWRRLCWRKNCQMQFKFRSAKRLEHIRNGLLILGELSSRFPSRGAGHVWLSQKSLPKGVIHAAHSDCYSSLYRLLTAGLHSLAFWQHRVSWKVALTHDSNLFMLPVECRNSWIFWTASSENSQKAVSNMFYSSTTLLREK